MSSSRRSTTSGRSRAHAFLAGTAMAVAFATGTGSAEGAGSLAVTLGGRTVALASVTVPLTCARAGASGRRISAAYASALSVEANDALADAALGYAAATSVPYHTARVRADAATLWFEDVQLDDVSRGAKAGDFRFALRGRLMDAASGLPLPSAAALAALAQPEPTATPTPSATPGASAAPRPAPSPMLLLGGVGSFALNATRTSPLTALGSVRIDGSAAQRLLPICVSGQRVRGITLVSSAGSTRFDSARVAMLEQHYDRSGLHYSIVTFSDILREAPIPQASPTP